ncbi:hypothetical protein CMK21_15620 [Candidatus Poribacteria bacterium]|nr:hypothetical protein [Candidatus Poribacteria bacterium]
MFESVQNQNFSILSQQDSKAIGESEILCSAGWLQLSSGLELKKLTWQFSGQTIAAPDSQPTYHIRESNEGECPPLGIAPLVIPARTVASSS